MPYGWRTIKSLVQKNRLHGRRGKEMADSFSREKVRHAPQKEGGWEILCDLPPMWPRLVRPTNLMSRMNGKKTQKTHIHKYIPGTYIHTYIPRTYFSRFIFKFQREKKRSWEGGARWQTITSSSMLFVPTRAPPWLLGCRGSRSCFACFSI